MLPLILFNRESFVMLISNILKDFLFYNQALRRRLNISYIDVLGLEIYA